jgi:toxic protein SymE
MFFNIRKSTISALCVRPRWKKSYVKPKITISGNWLNNAGFGIGEKVKIEVFKNKLIITKND